ncbi:hypothetical protein QCA50_003795 [Cerrena zonata]|uniref:Uncharacterized protein n=1 Tax=Cerrena zonata TaxID=2478898 RepID=A0AAW0GK37_9APHY
MQEKAPDLEKVFSSTEEYFDSIENHLDEVAGMLKESPEIGKGHTLYVQWHALRKDWYDARVESRSGARDLARFLGYERDRLCTKMRQGDLGTKQVCLDKFIQEMQKQEQSIFGTIQRFSNLKDRIDLFSEKIQDALHGKGITGLMKRISNYLSRFAAYVIKLSDALAKAACEYIDSKWSNTPEAKYTRPSLLSLLLSALKEVKYDPSPARIITETERYTKELHCMLEALEKAFGEYRMRCQLLSQVLIHFKSRLVADAACEAIAADLAALDFQLLIDGLYGYGHLGFPAVYRWYLWLWLQLGSSFRLGIVAVIVISWGLIFKVDLPNVTPTDLLMTVQGY